jgi:1,4-dihydroxy-2-naphthoate octaprenyltransferase
VTTASNSTNVRAGEGHRIRRGVWRLADPKITLASGASMLLGAAAAGHDGPIAWGWLAVTVLGMLAIEAAKNASGEVFDWDSGADRGLRPEERTPFSGGKRVIVDGLLSRAETGRVAAVGYVLGLAAGLAIVLGREPAVLWFGLAGVGLAYFYHAPPLRLSYRGLGELAVALAYGPIVAVGTYLVQRHAVSRGPVLASVPLGIAIAAFLWINELPDARADALAGKRTLVVRLGRRRAGRALGALFALAYGALALLPLAGLPATVLLGAVGLSPAWYAARTAARAAGAPAALVPAQVAALLSFVLLAAGMAAGLLLAR